MDSLLFLLSCLADDEEMFLSAFDVNCWPEEVLRYGLEAGWLQEAALTYTVNCPGCEQYCAQPVLG
jgi:hypothetical protein